MDDGARVIREEKNSDCTNFIELDDDEISNHVGATQIWMISDSREAFDKSKPPMVHPIEVPISFLNFEVSHSHLYGPT